MNQMWILKNSKALLEYIESRYLSSCNSITTFDFFILYTTISHSMLNSVGFTIALRCAQCFVCQVRGLCSCPKNCFTIDVCFCGAIFKVFCFGAFPDIMIELIECVTKQAVMTAAVYMSDLI